MTQMISISRQCDNKEGIAEVCQFLRNFSHRLDDIGRIEKETFYSNFPKRGGDLGSSLTIFNRPLDADIDGLQIKFTDIMKLEGK